MGQDASPEEIGKAVRAALPSHPTVESGRKSVELLRSAAEASPRPR